MMIKEQENTFGDYQFESWVPEKIRSDIRSFWRCAGGTYKDWLENPKPEKLPRNGEEVVFYRRDHCLSKEHKMDIYRQIQGRYIHRWNNIGNIVFEDGNYDYVSSCDDWMAATKEG